MPGFRTLSLAALVAIGLWAPPAVAQEAYPSRLVKVVVPFPPGSTLDALARILTDRMAQRWGQPVIIENVSGGGGNIGAERVARSAPDGYTLMFSPPGPLTINPLLYSDVAYDPAKFVPVSLLAKVPNVLIVRNTLGAGSVAEVIALAKANPDKLTYASQGVGSTAFLTAKLFETRAGIRLVHVPYRGAGPALNDIVAGHVDMMFDTAATSSPLHRAGTAKILAIADLERSGALPQVPTFAESGLSGFRSITWFASVAPPGTPTSTVERIQKDLAEIVRQPEVSAKLNELMLEPVAGHAGASRAVLRRGDRAVGQGDPRHRREGAVMPTSSAPACRAGAPGPNSSSGCRRPRPSAAADGPGATAAARNSRGPRRA
jgi:tripartite-type tricarboxylate transporter receptor subunit TctC